MATSDTERLHPWAFDCRSVEYELKPQEYLHKQPLGLLVQLLEVE